MSRKEDILAKCIAEVLSGRSTVEDCLLRYPELRDELKPLLEIALGIQPPKVAPSPEFRQRSRKRLLEVMEPVKAAESKKEVTHKWFIPVMSIRAVATLLLVFVVLMTGTGTAYAAQSSLPGDKLYPVKIGVEKLQVAVTINPEDKAYLHLEQAERRIDEVATQVSLNRIPDVSGLATLPAQTDAALREIEKVRPEDTVVFLSRLAESTINQQVTLGSLITTSHEDERDTIQQTMSTAQRANLIAQAAYNNSAFLRTSPSVSDKDLEQGRFKVTGTLLTVTGRTWNIGGMTLSNVHYSGEIPPIGSHVNVEGLSKKNEVYIIKLEEAEGTEEEGNIEGLSSDNGTSIGEQQEEKSRKEIKIEGRFKGTDESGEKWFIGELTVNAPEDKTLPAEGEKVEVQAVTRDGSVSIKNVEREKEEDREKEDEAKLEGKLRSVDMTKKVITVKVTGASIILNVSSAEIRTKDGKEVILSEMASMVGKDIKAYGLVKKDSVLFASKVRIYVENKSKDRSSD